MFLPAVALVYVAADAKPQPRDEQQWRGRGRVGGRNTGEVAVVL